MNSVAIIPSSRGFHWEEVFAAYKIYKDAGWQIHFYTVDGQPPNADPNSIKERPVLSYFGLGVRHEFSPESQLGEELRSKLQKEILPVGQIDTNILNTIYIPGGHGCLFDVNINATVHQKILQMYNDKKIISAVCHGTSCLALVKKDGESIIKNKRVVGFLDMQDTLLLNMGLIDKNFLPLPYQNEKTIKDAGGIITAVDEVSAFFNPAYVVEDLPFVTGVGPKAAAPVAKRVVELIKEKVH